MKMNVRLLIVGDSSFIASNIFYNLKKKIYIKKIKYSKFLKKNKLFLSNFNYIVNCSLHKKYVLEKYDKKYDLDYQVLNKIKDLNINYIFLSSRKVYKPKFNIKETNKILPQDNYSKNKLTTENFIKTIIPNNFLILRISNVIGKRIFNNNKSHDLFLDNFMLNIKSNFVLNHKDVFKDFISIDQFTYIFLKIIQKNLKGIFNVSLGKKVYVNEILQWLTSSCKKSLNINNFYYDKKYNSHCFTLNNNKLKQFISVSIKKKDLKMYCLKLSKKIFLRKK